MSRSAEGGARPAALLCRCQLRTVAAQGEDLPDQPVRDGVAIVARQKIAPENRAKKSADYVKCFQLQSQSRYGPLTTLYAGWLFRWPQALSMGVAQTERQVWARISSVEQLTGPIVYRLNNGGKCAVNANSVINGLKATSRHKKINVLGSVTGTCWTHD